MAKKEVPVFREDQHYLLWDWLSKNPRRSKSGWPGWRGNGGENNPHEFFCFSCIYADQVNQMGDVRKIKEDSCPNCPLCSGGDSTLSNCLNGKFWEWMREGKIRKKSALARQIRDLPTRTDWEWSTVEQVND